MCDEECSLVERLVQLDNSAWEEFCRKYSGPLLAGVRLRFGASQELAEEIVHMTFIRCVKSIKTFDPARGRLFGWLNAIARNEAHTLLRKASPPGRVELDPEDRQWIERIDEAALPDEQLCRQEFRSLILETVMELSSHHRQVLVMKYLEDRKVAEMAVMLGQSEKAVESMLTRSRLALKEQLCKRFREPAAQGDNWL
jgi:RNA polymerase sigma-70 factor (ECF subfamily)